jgi:L-malate glycosyltransferase
MKVLFFSAWYPTERDAMAGLFVQKHADAVRGAGADVRVLYSEKTGLAWLCEMVCGLRRLQKEWGLPDVVQMNVLDKNGVLALWLKRRYRIPYVIVEHWSGYLPANKSFKGGWHGSVMRHITRHASCILPVSNMLGEAMRACGIENAHWHKVNNVVDDFFYTLPADLIPRQTNKIRLLHVSCFDEKAKDVQGLLRAYRNALNTNLNMELVLVGTGIDFQVDKEYADSLDFPADSITWTGELTPQEVCQWMYSSDAFVLFSRYETFSVVLAESQVVGLPIITSRVAGIAEDLPTDCGIAVDPEDEQALTKAILYMFEHLQDYPAEKIRPYGRQYSFESVGKVLMATYLAAIERS